MEYIEVFTREYAGYANYLWHEVTNPHWGNYFYWLIGLSLAVWGLELAFPWRKNQKSIRKDFWLDVFYMFFNFFLFSLIVYNALSNVVVAAFNDFLALFGITNTVAITIDTWHPVLQLLTFFVLRDFIHWNIHRLLHRVPWLWEFHKVHHSVKEMGFAAHLRYHWVENVVYRTLEYLPLAMLGFGLIDLFVVHIFTLTIGHLNHANIKLPLGPLKYIFNSPQMHIWHHAKAFPEPKAYGVNFALTLSIWDYLFGTAYIPADGRDITLGFDHDENFPDNFATQSAYGFVKKGGPG